MQGSIVFLRLLSPDNTQPSMTPLTRSCEAPVIHPPMPTSEKFRNSLLYTGIKWWNELPNDMRNNSDYNSFKTALKRIIYPPFLPSLASDA